MHESTPGVSPSIGMSHEVAYTHVLGRRLAHIEQGSGRPIVLLHGNPTSAYLWRSIIPGLAGSGRVIAPDLIGHGWSDKLPESEGDSRYSFERTFEFLDAQLELLGAVEDVILVGHDWGGGLAFHWAQAHPERTAGIAYMETIVCPLTWDDFPEAGRGIFRGFRSPKGEDLVLNRNRFVEAVLPSSILRDLTADEMAAYRRPFETPEDRRPTLAWPRQLPIDGEPAGMNAVIRAHADFMGSTDIPKLFINAEPGSILVDRQREFCRSWPAQEEATVRGSHFIQEDSPSEIVEAVTDWLQRVRQPSWRDPGP